MLGQTKISYSTTRLEADGAGSGIIPLLVEHSTREPLILAKFNELGCWRLGSIFLHVEIRKVGEKQQTVSAFPFSPNTDV